MEKGRPVAIRDVLRQSDSSWQLEIVWKLGELIEWQSIVAWQL